MNFYFELTVVIIWNTNFDVPLESVFECISQQVNNDLSNPIWIIGKQRWGILPVIELQIDLFLNCFQFEEIQTLFDQFTKIHFDGYNREFSCFNLR